MKPWIAKATLVGAGLGLAAGLVFAAAQGVLALAGGASLERPLRLAASVLLGGGAATAGLAPVAALGAALHLALSTLYGVVYALLSAASLSMSERRNFVAQGVSGALFGLALWTLNFQGIARLLAPWLLDLPQLAQATLHALFFGLPLGVGMSVVERRRLTVVEEPVDAARRVERERAAR